MTNKKDGTNRHVIYKIIYHILYESKHLNVAIGEKLYQVRWYGYTASADIWETINHFPHGKVLSYYHVC